MKQKLKIEIHTSKIKKGTCGTCLHTQNDYGVFALHCDMWINHKKLTPHITKEDSKVRSWYKKCKYYNERKIILKYDPKTTHKTY